MLDAQGRLFGRINIIDLSFLIIVLATASGLAWVMSGNSPLEKKITARGTASVMVAIRGARVQDPKIFKEGEMVFITIRNQRYEPVRVTQIVQRPRQVVFLGNDNKPVVLTDPTTPEVIDVDLTFEHPAEDTAEGVVMGGHHMKVGNSVELDAYGYRFNGSIMKVNFAAQ